MTYAQHNNEEGLRYLREPSYSKALLKGVSQVSLNASLAQTNEDDRREIMIQASVDSFEEL